MITLVGAEHLGMNAPGLRAHEQLPHGAMLSGGRFGDEEIDAKPVAFLHGHMPAVAALGELAFALAHESGLRIGRALVVRRARALLAFEIDHPGAFIGVFGRRDIHGLKVLPQRSSGATQRSLVGEVARGQQHLLPSQIEDLFVEAPGNIGRHNALTQAAGFRPLQRRAVTIHVEEPHEQDLLVQLLAKLPVGANPIQRDQQLDLEQAFRRNRWPAARRVRRAQLRRIGA